MTLTEDSAVYKIFHYSFVCSVPRYSTVSEQEIDRLGSYVNEINDNLSPHQPVHVLLTLDDIAELFRSGIPVEVVSSDDIPIIYDIITEHLQMWLDYGRTTISRFRPPMDDLALLDDIANCIYNSIFTSKDRSEGIELPEQLLGPTTLSGDSITTETRKSPLMEIAELVESKRYTS